MLKEGITVQHKARDKVAIMLTEGVIILHIARDKLVTKCAIMLKEGMIIPHIARDKVAIILTEGMVIPHIARDKNRWGNGERRGKERAGERGVVVGKGERWGKGEIRGKESAGEREGGEKDGKRVREGEMVPGGNVKELFGDVKNQSKVEIDKLRKFRAEINTYLDRRENELLDNIKKVNTEDENALSALKTDCELTKTGLEAMRTELTSGDVSVNQRYVASRRSQKELRRIYDNMEKMADRMNARKYLFTKDADTERLLGSKRGLGTLDVAGEFRKNISAFSSSVLTFSMLSSNSFSRRRSSHISDVVNFTAAVVEYDTVTTAKVFMGRA
ncbi:hypothetical protein MAR_026851, partial [Mya arenaria]